MKTNLKIQAVAIKLLYLMALMSKMILTLKIKITAGHYADPCYKQVAVSSLLAVGLICARWPSPHRQYCEVVGGHVASLPTSCLHQTPLRVPSFVVRLQDTNRLAGPKRNFMVSSRREAVGCKHLEERMQS